MNRFLVSVTTSAILVISLLSPVHANLITNHSFETPVVPVVPGFTAFNPGDTFTGWSVVGPSGGNVAIISGTFTFGTFTFPAQDGLQWLDLTGTTSSGISGTGVQQAVSTVPGTTYDLSFYVGNDEGPFGTQSAVNLLIDDLLVFTATNTAGAGTNTLNWEQFDFAFTATGASTTLAFINADSDPLNGLDNIVLLARNGDPNGGPNGASEPASLLLLAIGLIGLGVARRSKKI